MRRAGLALALATLLFCASRSLADSPLTQDESHNLGTTETPEYVLDKGRVSETIVANVSWSWSVYKREDLTTETCTSEKCGPDEHRDVITVVPKWDFRDTRLINPNTRQPRSGDDLKRELGGIVNGVFHDADLQGAVTAATADIRDAGNTVEFGNLPEKGLKDLAKALEDKRKQVEKLRVKNIKLGHWAPTCYTQQRDFWRNLYALKVIVSLVKHRVVTDRGAAKATDSPIGKPQEAILAVATLDQLNWTDKPPLYCCPEGEGGKGKNEQPPKEKVGEKPKENGGAPTTVEKKPTPTRTATPRRTPAPRAGGTGMAPSNLRATLVGIVEARDSRIGEPATLRVVLDPRNYEGHPGLTVEHAKLRLPRNRHGRAVLKGMVVTTPDGREHPADAPVNLIIPAASEITLAVGLPGEANPPGTRPEEVQLKLSQPPAGKPRKASTIPSMLPVVPADGICLVHGKFRGDASATEIKVNGETAEILAQTPRETWFVPHALKNGRNRVTVTEDGRTTAFEVYAPKLEIRASRTVMRDGDTADVSITAKDLEGLPQDEWRAGTPDELYDLSSAPAAALNAPGEGKMLLVVKNDSPEIVTMAAAQGNVAMVVLSRADIERGDVFHTVLTAHREGSFVLEAELQPLFAEVSGTTDGGEESAGAPPPSPTPAATREREQREPTAQEQKDFARWWAGAFGYGIAPELDARTLAWWRAREAEQNAKDRVRKTQEAFDKARQSAIDADPLVKKIKGDIANLNRVLSLPQAADEPEYKKKVEARKRDREADLKQAEKGAEEKWRKTKEATQLDRDLREASRDYDTTHDTTSKAAKEVPEDARKSIEEAEKHAGESPPQAEPQEKAMER